MEKTSFRMEKTVIPNGENCHPEWRKLSSRIYFGICELMLEQDAETSSA